MNKMGDFPDWVEEEIKEIAVEFNEASERLANAIRVDWEDTDERLLRFVQAEMLGELIRQVWR